MNFTKLPKFRHYGGKFRLRQWLLSHFPSSGNKYAEVFAGKANVYFAARHVLNFKEWYLNDNNPKFLKTLQTCDIDTLSKDWPENITREFFVSLRTAIRKNPQDANAILLEHRISFSGKGYDWGLDLSCIEGRTTKTRGWIKSNYIKTLKEGQELLKDVHLTSLDFKHFDYSQFGPNDFIYFDPPYTNRLYHELPYDDINQEELVEVLNNLKCKWAISNYDNDIYNHKLKYKKSAIRTHQNHTKSSQKKGNDVVIEKLWMNYD